MAVVDSIKKGFLMGGIATIVVVGLGIGGWFAWDKWDRNRAETDEVVAESILADDHGGDTEVVEGESVEAEEAAEVAEEEEIMEAEADQQGAYKVMVYFSNAEMEAEEDDGAIHVYGVERYTDSSAVATFGLEQMLNGPTDNEKAQGYYSELNVENWSAGEENPFRITIQNSIAYVDFKKPLSFTGDLSPARVQKQVSMTISQFPTVDDVVVKVLGDLNWE